MGNGHWFMKDMCFGVYGVKRIGMDGGFPNMPEMIDTDELGRI
jgi:hypothetical protein